MPHDFAWDDIRYFLAVSRAETLTEAARRLRVSQPTVGRRLRALEEKLGATLFERHTDRVALTEAGRALLPFAEDMERQSHDLSRALDGITEPAQRLVRVTAIGSLALFFARSFADLEARCAPSAVELISTGERLNLARQEADIAFRMNAVPARGDLVCRKVGRLAFALYTSPAYAREVAGEALEENPTARFVGYRQNPRKKSQSGWLFRFGQNGAFPLRVGELHLRHEAARLGLGITILPCHLGDAADDLVRVHPPIAELEEEIYLLMHESARSQPAVRRVADALTDLIQDRQDRLLGRTQV